MNRMLALIAIVLVSALPLLAIGAGEASAISLLGSFDFTGANADSMDVSPNLVYIGSGYGQTGLIRVNAANPAAMSQTTLSGGGGVAVNQTTARYATTDGGNQLQVRNPNDTLFDTETLTGCGGALAAGTGNTFGVNTRCTDTFHIYDEDTASIVFSTPLGVVGSSVVSNPATGNYYANRDLSTALVVTPSFMTSSLAQAGTVQEANGLLNRLYLDTGTNLLVLDGSTHGTLATLTGISGDVAVNTGLNRFYVIHDGAIKVFDGVTNTQIVGETFTLPDGYVPIVMDMAAGDDRLYVVGLGPTTVFAPRLFALEDTAAPIPEPGTLVLLGSGLLGGAAWARGRRKRTRTEG